MIHHVFANRANIGDWLSARAIQSLLAPQQVTEHLCGELRYAETLDRLENAPSDDWIVVGGGGLFMDYFVPFWQGFRKIAHRMPFCIWGVGYCDMKRVDSRPPQDLIEEIVRASRLCIVRDELTRQYLSACRLPPPIACPTMSLIHPQPPGWGLLHVDAYDNVGEANYQYMEAQGRDFAVATGRPYDSFNNEVCEGSERALDAALAKYAGVDLILTGRLHACIIGVAMGRKVLAVSGDRKVESFMEAAGLGDWVLDLSDTERVPNRLRELPGQREPLQFVDAARRAHRAVAAKIKLLLSSP